MSAGRPRRRDELTPSLTDLPGRLAEEQLRTQLKPDPHRARVLRREFSVAAIEPALFPAVGLVRQIVFGARATIPVLSRPPEALVEPLALRLDGTRGEDHAGLELREPCHHRVVAGRPRAPRGEVPASPSDHPP